MIYSDGRVFSAPLPTLLPAQYPHYDGQTIEPDETRCIIHIPRRRRRAIHLIRTRSQFRALSSLTTAARFRVTENVRVSSADAGRFRSLRVEGESFFNHLPETRRICRRVLTCTGVARTASAKKTKGAREGARRSSRER